MHDRPRKHECQRSRTSLLVRREAVGEDAYAFPVVDSTEAEEERPLVDADDGARVGFVAASGVHAEAHDESRRRRHREQSLGESALGVAPVRQARARSEELLEDTESDHGFVVRCRMEH
jgi:hypothetical protein